MLSEVLGSMSCDYSLLESLEEQKPSSTTYISQQSPFLMTRSDCFIINAFKLQACHQLRHHYQISFVADCKATKCIFLDQGMFLLQSHRIISTLLFHSVDLFSTWSVQVPFGPSSILKQIILPRPGILDHKSRLAHIADSSQRQSCQDANFNEKKRGPNCLFNINFSSSLGLAVVRARLVHAVNTAVVSGLFQLVQQYNKDVNFWMRKQPRNRLSSTSITPIRQVEQFYDPLQPFKLVLESPSKPKNACVTLFADEDEPQDFTIPDSEESRFVSTNFISERPLSQMEETNSQDHLKGDQMLKKILANSKQPTRGRRHFSEKVETIPEIQQLCFCFNSNLILKYPQTPHFKNQLQSPFWKFNQQHQVHMECLKQKTTKNDFQALPLHTDPLNFVASALKYYVGVALTLKDENVNASRALLKLGCYVEPFNEKAWKKYIENEEQLGYMKKAMVLSKTAFLFTNNQQFARIYISNGEKCGVSLGELRGILSSSPIPQTLQKGALVEMGKLTLKHQQTWKGLKVLYQIIQWNQFRLPVCALIIFLAKYLQNIGQRDKALYLLKRSFGRGMSKLQVYTTYLDMKVREAEGELSQNVLSQIMQYIDCISSENRYRVYLEVAQYLFKGGDQRYAYYIEQAYLAAKKYCAPGTGCNKTLKQIYYSLLRWKNAPPLHSLPLNDQTAFELNRYSYINEQDLRSYQFSDWKYYLHYGLVENGDSIAEVSKKWSYTGRLIAEAIHRSRMTVSPAQALLVWREKIDEIPKSGELWCEGGRIYAEMGQSENASKCFKAAIHFTPQYGDSFVQQLRLCLMRGQLMQAHQLKKQMLVAQPFYGHVWSFLRESSPTNARLSLSDMWNMATHHINTELYSLNTKLFTKKEPEKRLTALSPYNQAYASPKTPAIRKKLFASYEQLQNKN